MTRRKLATTAATVFTVSVVLAAVVWALDERNQVGFALRSAAPAPRRPRPSPVRDVKLPGRVTLALDAQLPHARPNLRVADVDEPLPGWSTRHLGYSSAECTRIGAELLESGQARLTLVLGYWAHGESFQFELTREAFHGSELGLAAHFYSCLQAPVDKFTGKPAFEMDWSVDGVEGVLTLASSRFEPGARIPFHFAAASRSYDRRWEARGVFEFP